MSQKLFKILLISVLVIGLVILGIILVRAKNKKDATQIQTNIENPFGIDSDDTSIGGSGGNNSNSQNNQTNEEENTKTPIAIDFVSNDDSSTLKKISEEPVAGATFMYIEREIKLPEEVSANLVEGYDFTGYPSLKFGDDRKEVADIKTVLNRQTPSPSLTIDNAFDTNLKNAVIEFQEKNGLTPDGVVGSGTYRKLNEFQGIAPKTTKAPEKETVEFVRFVDRANGYIYDKTTKLSEPLTRVTSSQVARVYEAYFDNSKNSILMRYLKDGVVENIVASIKKPAIETETARSYSTIDTTLLSNKISFVSPLLSGQKVFYLTKESSGSAGYVYDFKTKQTKKVWNSKFSDFIPQWINENTVSLTTRASGKYPGNSYILDIKNNSMRNIISNVNGLTTNVSPDGKMVIYSSYENGSLKTLLLNIATGKISDFSPTTLPEKCVWTTDSKTVYCGAPGAMPLSLFPDDWYKGETLFRDMLWKVDATTNTAKIILDTAKTANQLDMTNPMVNQKEDYFIFINKHDLNLYVIDFSKF